MKPKLRNLLLGVVGLGAAAFAVQGGEYATTDLLSQRSRKAALQHQIDSLQREVDSLVRVKRGVLNDPVVQERIAREEFGMIKGEKEILYRFAEPADTGRSP